jgi:hypothetical protein
LVRNDKSLTPHERVAWEVMKNAGRKLSTNEVANFGNMSWLTAKKTLNKLYRKRRTLHKKTEGRAKIWFIK